jgi:HD-like signal output (HDOD) protein
MTAKATLIAAAIGRAGQLATLPDAAMEVIRIADQPNATAEDLADALLRDPTLGARVLKIVNSAYYGARREVTSITAAINMLGFSAIKSIAMAASLTRLFRGGVLAGGFDIRELWRHSLAVAVASRELARQVDGVEPSEAFLAGLVHDIGLVIALQSCREQLALVVRDVADIPTLDFCAAEELHIGATHAELGAALCETWRLPTVLHAVTRYHHAPRPDDVALVYIVALADHLAAQPGLGYTRTVRPFADDVALRTALALDADTVTAVRDALPALLDAVAPAFADGAE